MHGGQPHPPLHRESLGPARPRSGALPLPLPLRRPHRRWPSAPHLPPAIRPHPRSGRRVHARPHLGARPPSPSLPHQDRGRSRSHRSHEEARPKPSFTRKHPGIPRFRRGRTNAQIRSVKGEVGSTSQGKPKSPAPPVLTSAAAKLATLTAPPGSHAAARRPTKPTPAPS